MRTPLRIPAVDQADSFRMEVTQSLRYLLLLNGVVPEGAGINPVRSGSQALLSHLLPSQPDGPAWLMTALAKVAPDKIPGTDGPITVVMIL